MDVSEGGVEIEMPGLSTVTGGHIRERVDISFHTIKIYYNP